MKSLQEIINEQTEAESIHQDTGIEKGQRKDVDEKVEKKEKDITKEKEESKED